MKRRGRALRRRYGHSMQPFRSDQMVILEKRHADGSLDFSGEQAPHRPMKFDAVYRLYFHANPHGGSSASWDDLKTWLDSKGWKVRAKTWWLGPVRLHEIATGQQVRS